MENITLRRIVLWYAPIFLWLAFLSASLLQVRYFDLLDMDFSIFLVQPWSISKGLGWNVPFSLVHDFVPYYIRHVTPLSALLAPIIGFFESPYALITIHATSCGLFAWLLPRVTRAVYQTFGGEREHLWLWTAACLLVIFSVYAPFILPWYRATHYTTLVSPFGLLAILALHRGRMGYVWLCCLMLALGQERASIAIFGVGMYAFLLLGRRRLGVALCLASCAWFFTATQVYVPWLLKAYNGTTGYTFMNMFEPFSYLPEKARYLLLLLAYTLCLPLLGKRAFLVALCAAPTLATSMVSNSVGMFDLKHQYSDLPSIFLLCSAIYGMLWIQERKQWPVLKKAFTAALAAYVLIVITGIGGWYTPYLTAARLWTQPQRAELDIMNQEIRNFWNMPEGVTLYAQAGIGPSVALNKGRLMMDPAYFDDQFKQSVVVLSPRCLTHARNYAYFVENIDKNTSLEVLRDNGRLRVYISPDLRESHPELVQKLSTGIAP